MYTDIKFNLMTSLKPYQPIVVRFYTVKILMNKIPVIYSTNNRLNTYSFMFSFMQTDLSLPVPCHVRKSFLKINKDS